MNTKRLAGIVILILIFIMGCSGTKGKLKTQSEGDAKVTQQELINNWPDYNVRVFYSKAPGLSLIVFDPKNDHKKILVGSNWDTVKDQETWTEIVKANTTNDGDFSMAWAGYDYSTTGVQEILGPDNQLYGFIIYQKIVVDWVSVKLVDKNTIQLSWKPTGNQGAPAS